MDPAGILGLLGVVLYFVAILVIDFLRIHPSPNECNSKGCAKTGMNYGLSLIGIAIVAFTLIALMFLFPNTKVSSGFTDFMFLAFSIVSTGLILYGIYTWKSYREVHKELLLQEAIAKGIEIGMKKAKET